MYRPSTSSGVRGMVSPGRSDGRPTIPQQRAALPKPDGNLCSYSSYNCNSEKLPGYEFCLRHILCDKNAPFKPCGYSADSQTGGVKCSRPAPYYNRGDSYCAQHTKVILAARQKSNKKRKGTPNVLLESLSPYKKSKADPLSSAGASSSSNNSLGHVNPFQVQETKDDQEAEGLGAVALDSDGIQNEEEDTLIANTWTGGEGESEGESVDSEGEDSLQHAGVYTVEEVMRTLKDKLVKLQKLYIDQFQRLVYKMKESRREYLNQLKHEKEAGLINISDQPNRDLEYERLKAMMHYYSPSGREALLSLKHREKRLALSGNASKQQSFCQHTLTTTTKCGAVCIPMARYCMKHILEEKDQVLYRACGQVTPADGPCENPVANLFPHTTCVYHTKTPILDLSALHPPSPVPEPVAEASEATNPTKSEEIPQKSTKTEEPQESFVNNKDGQINPSDNNDLLRGILNNPPQIKIENELKPELIVLQSKPDESSKNAAKTDSTIKVEEQDNLAEIKSENQEKETDIKSESKPVEPSEKETPDVIDKASEQSKAQRVWEDSKPTNVDDSLSGDKEIAKEVDANQTTTKASEVQDDTSKEVDMESKMETSNEEEKEAKIDSPKASTNKEDTKEGQNQSADDKDAKAIDAKTLESSDNVDKTSVDNQEKLSEIIATESIDASAQHKPADSELKASDEKVDDDKTTTGKVIDNEITAESTSKEDTKNEPTAEDSIVKTASEDKVEEITNDNMTSEDNVKEGTDDKMNSEDFKEDTEIKDNAENSTTTNNSN